ncbi:MAG: hypothetical protein JSW47_00790 [Phycisphaerales bacterium]|nr:MAG: hypothetical protein JSW47_00790 [Phycisphaerales bacterium]
MESIKQELSDREKQEASIRLLRKLGEQLQSSDASTRRRAAYNLSWMQEDGLEILKGILFGSFQITAKNASAYGLRKMRGRMKKMALEVLEQGLKHSDNSTKQVCRNALQLLGQKVPGGAAPKRRTGKRTRIKEISHESRPKTRNDTRRGIGIRRTRG